MNYDLSFDNVNLKKKIISGFTMRPGTYSKQNFKIDKLTIL